MYYVYGADGLRHHSSLTTAAGMTTTTDYALDGQNVIQDMRTISGVLMPIATYLTGPSGPMYRRDDGQGSIRWYVYDGLGSVVGEVDPNGVMTARRGFDVYGATRSSSGVPTSKHGFVGALGHTSEDESGLVYMRARWYDAGVGRVESQDHGRASHKFIYCENSPVNKTDVTGNFVLPADAEAVAEWIGMEASEAQGLADFSSWYTGEISEALARENFQLLVEFVADGTIEPGLGDGRFIALAEKLTVQLQPAGANAGTFVHELAEAQMWYTNTSGIVSEAEASLMQTFTTFF